MTAQNLRAYNGYVEIMGGNSANTESLYVGGRARLRSVALGVGSSIESLWVNRNAFICGIYGSIILPSNAVAGEMIFVKGGQGYNITVYAPSGGKIMVPWDSGLVDSWNIEQKSVFFIYAGFNIQPSETTVSNGIWVAFGCD